MNKATKGALAAAAAAAILAGGAGTMAAWTSSASGTNGGTVTAGSMTVTESVPGVWKWVGGNKNGTAVDFDNDKIVPGDKIAYSATYTVNLVGTNLKADLEATLAGVSGDLLPLLTVTNTGGSITDVTSGAHPVTTQVEFKPDTTGTTGQAQTADLSGASVVLTQKF